MTPTPDEVRAAREAAGLTQTQAGEAIFAGRRTWQNFEAAEGTKENRPMPEALFELFLYRTRQKKVVFYKP